jgi:hypothetical protein
LPKGGIVPKVPWTSETARQAGLKGGKASAAARRKKAEVRADLRARATFEEAADKMAQVIVSAALGTGDFARLDPKERAQFALKALEYGVGRPRQQDPNPIQTDVGPQGLAFTAPEDPDAIRERPPT